MIKVELSRTDWFRLIRAGVSGTALIKDTEPERAKQYADILSDVTSQVVDISNLTEEKT